MFAYSRQLMAAAFLCVAQMSFAQGATSPNVLHGRVTDAITGKAVARVSILLVGTTFSAITDADGRYEIANAPSGVFTVEARRGGVGQSARDNVRVGGATPIATVTTLDFKLGGSRAPAGVEFAASPFRRSLRTTPFGVDRLSADNLPVASVASPAGMLAGKVAGVTVIQSSGAPGAAALIRLRNARGVNDSTPPLFVVDGVMLSPLMPMTDQDIESMDIDRMEVLKGVAASAYYGARGASGVIAITTKRGRALPLGAIQFSVRNEAGRDNIVNFFDLPQAHDFLVNTAGQYVNAAGVVVPRNQRLEQANRITEHPFIDPTFNHGDQFFRAGGFNTQTVNVQQNRASNNFSLSYSRSDQSGIVPNADGFQRQTVRGNFDQRWRDKLEVSLSASHGVSNEDPAAVDFQTLSYLWADVDLRAPDPTGAFPYVFKLTKSELFGDAENPLDDRLLGSDRIHRQRTLTSLKLSYRPLSWLSFDVLGSYDRGIRNDNGLYGSLDSISPVVQRAQSVVSNADSTRLGVLQGGITASKRIGGLTAMLRAAGERQHETADQQITGRNIVVVGGVVDTIFGENKSTSQKERIIEARFANLGLDYAGKYTADLLFRRDQFGRSANHGPHANSARVAIGWLLNQEPWFPFDHDRLLKVRYSASSIQSAADVDVSSFPLGAQVTYPPPNKISENEVGVDMDITSRMRLSLAYATATSASSFERLTPSQTYFPATIPLMGSSVEATVNWRAIDDAKGLRWDVSLIGDHRTNTITSSPISRCIYLEPVEACTGRPLASMVKTQFVRSKARLAQGIGDTSAFDVNDEGYVVYVGAGNSWRDGKAKNLWGTAGAVAGQGFAWGMPIVDLAIYGVDDDLRDVHDVSPDFNYGVQNTIQFKGFAFYTQFAGQIGGEIFNEAKRIRYRLAADPVLDQSGKPDDERKPLAYYRQLGTPSSELFYENATNARLAEASIGYTFDANRFGILKHIGAKQVEIDVVGRNLFTLSGYSGLNVQGNSLNASIEQFYYPLTRTYTLATSIKF